MFEKFSLDFQCINDDINYQFKNVHNILKLFLVKVFEI
jgi:hypothetical protein